eukprot:749146-Hanusia_phi.AAC.5
MRQPHRHRPCGDQQSSQGHDKTADGEDAGAAPAHGGQVGEEQPLPHEHGDYSDERIAPVVEIDEELGM